MANPAKLLDEIVDIKKELEYLLKCNHKAVDQYLSRITELREELETEEARLAFCLFEKRKLLEELKRNAA